MFEHVVGIDGEPIAVRRQATVYAGAVPVPPPTGLSPPNVTLTTPEGPNVSIFNGNFLDPPPALTATVRAHGGVTAVYDKDAFGAIDPTERASYLHSLTSLLVPGAIVLLEVKKKSADQDKGPPFHLLEADVAREFVDFDRISYRECAYDIEHPSYTQQLFVLRYRGGKGEE